MALGGGNWIIQNKILSGAYINFISKPQSGNPTSNDKIAKLGIGKLGEIKI